MEKTFICLGAELQVQTPNRGFRYDEGLVNVLAQGYKRLPNISELFSVTTHVLNGTQDSRLIKIDKTLGYEWVNLAWEVKDGKLVTYTGPQGLSWQEPKDPLTKGLSYKYRTPNFKYDSKKEFSLPSSYGKDLGKGFRHYLSEFNGDFLKFHLGVLFQDLPKKMRGERSVIIDLPRENFLVPVAYQRLFGLDEGFGIVFGHIGCYGKARGARNVSSY